MKQIIEKQLGIQGDYQYQALRTGNFLQANWHANKLSVIAYLLKKYRPKTILDLGAGSGNLELTFASQVKKIIAVDYNDDAVRFLKRQIKANHLTNVIAKQSDLADTKSIQKLGTFDLIIMVDVLEHLELPVSEKLITAFKKMLTTNGRVVIITPNYQSLWPWLERFVDRFTSIPDLAHCQHVSHFTPNNILPPFLTKGFKLDFLRTFNLFSFAFPLRQLSTVAALQEIHLPLQWGNLLLAIFRR